MTEPTEPENKEEPTEPEPPKPKEPPKAHPPKPRPGQGSHVPRPFGMKLPKIPEAAPNPEAEEPAPYVRQGPSYDKSVTFTLTLILVTALAYVALVFISRNTILADGKAIHYYSFSKGTVRQVLSQNDVSVSSKDLVTPGLDQKLQWGQKIEVVRVFEKFERKMEFVDFILDWKRRAANNLRRVENQHGHSEKKIWFAKTVYHDGKEVHSEDSPKIVRKAPVERLALLNERGHPEKIYDLTKHKRMRLKATAYWKGDPQVPGVITFSGHKVQRGLVAVDPKVVPLGWRLYVPGYGYAYSSDTGSKIKGNRIDLFVESKKASRKWEYVMVDVYLLEKARKW